MYVRVRVKPGSRKESVIETDTQAFSISVKEPASQNMANTRVREIIAEHYRVALERVRMYTGHRSPQKVFSIEGL